MDDSKLSAASSPAAVDRPLGPQQGCRLLPGDVILTPARDWIGQAIQLFDDSPVSHVAILTSDSQVLEATPAGIDRRALVSGAEGSPRSIVCRRDPAPGLQAPLLSSAWERAAASDRDAYDPILLLAMILLAREVTHTLHLGALVNSVLEPASASVCTLLLGDRRRPLLSPWVAGDSVPGATLAGTLHPMSLLARTLRATSWKETIQPPAGPMEMQHEPSTSEAAAASREAETRFQQHVISLGRRESLELLASLEPAPLVPAITRLASTLCSAFLLTHDLELEADHPTLPMVPSPDPLAAGADPGANVPLVLAHLRRLAVNLVTPGDLLRSRSFVTVGTIDLV